MTDPNPVAPISLPSTHPAFSAHDHAHCRSAILDVAERRASAGNMRLTPVRRRVLEILLESHRALGAYEVLERLSAEGFGAQPPVAYRALDFLLEQGFAHRIRRLNAFTACMCPETDPEADHVPAFLICDGCRGVAELSVAPLRKALRLAAGDADFEVDRMNLEASGLCPACRDGAQ